jgi:predicted dehydrogenase
VNKITVAIVGLNFGELWVPIYQAHPDVAEVVLCDPIPDVLNGVGNTAGVPRRYGSLEEVLVQPGIDAVHLLTPLHLHAEQTFQVLQAGKHCAVAVTPSLEFDDLQRIVDAQGASGRNYMMMETGAYSDPVVHLRQLNAAGQLGGVTFAHGEHHQDMEGWPGYWVGLPPMWYSTHALAPLLRVIGGRPTTVRALGGGRLPADQRGPTGNLFPFETALYEVEGSAAAVQVTRSMFQTTRAAIESFSIYGERLGFEWGRTNDEDPLLFAWDGQNPNGRGKRVAVTPYTTPALNDLPPAVAASSQMYTGAAPRLVHEFVRSIVEERPAELDAVVAAQWTAAGFAAHESALAGGEPVTIPSFH